MKEPVQRLADAILRYGSFRRAHPVRPRADVWIAGMRLTDLRTAGLRTSGFRPAARQVLLLLAATASVSLARGAAQGVSAVPDARAPAPSITETLLHAELPPCDAAGQPPPAPASLKLPTALESRRLLLLRGKCALQRGDLAQAESIFRQGLADDKNLPRLWQLYLFATLRAQGRNIEAIATLADLLKAPGRNYVQGRVRQVLLAGLDAATPQVPAAAGAPPATSAAAAAAQDIEFDTLATYAANVRPGPDDYDLVERLLSLARPRGDDGLLQRLPVVLWRYPKNEATAQLGKAVLRAGIGRPSSGPGSSPSTRPGASGGPGSGPSSVPSASSGPGASAGGAPAVVAPALSAEDYAERARRLTDLRLFRLIALELGDSALPAADPETARRLGRSYFGALLQLKAYRQAADALERGVGMQRFAFDARENAAWQVRMALRRRNTQQVLGLLKELERIDPQADTLPGFYLELARQYEQSGDLGHLTEWCRRTIAAAPGSAAAGTAYWLLVWSHYQRKDAQAALDWADKGVAAAPALPWDQQPRLWYWKGRLEQAGGDEQAARQSWAKLAERWPSTYYGLIAAQASVVPAPARFARVQAQPPPSADPPRLDAVWRQPGLAGALFAYAAGEDAAAESLFQEGLAQPLPKEVVNELAELFLALNEHHLQQRLIASQGPFDLAQTAIGVTPAWRQAFPPAFWDLVVDEAGAEEISPHFVLAVMREESRFKVKADSKAGAKGLMQVMPSTAIELARKRRINLTEATLLLPEFNIPLGTLYLRDVLRRFDWNPIYAAAAYNAGPGTVLRWAKEWGGVPFDEFVERIPFEETQTYVKRVYASYLIYRALYP